MVQQSLNYSSEHYSYSLFERLFELIHRVLNYVVKVWSSIMIGSTRVAVEVLLNL